MWVGVGIEKVQELVSESELWVGVVFFSSFEVGVRVRVEQVQGSELELVVGVGMSGKFFTSRVGVGVKTVQKTESESAVRVVFSSFGVGVE